MLSCLHLLYNASFVKYFLIGHTSILLIGHCKQQGMKELKLLMGVAKYLLPQVGSGVKSLVLAGSSAAHSRLVSGFASSALALCQAQQYLFHQLFSVTIRVVNCQRTYDPI